MHTHPAYLICEFGAASRRRKKGRDRARSNPRRFNGTRCARADAIGLRHMLVTPRRETERAVSCSLASSLTPPPPLPRCQVIPDKMRQFTTGYRPNASNLETKLKVFIPEMLPVRTRCACSPFRAAFLMEYGTPLPVDGLASYHYHTQILSLLQQPHSTHARPVHRCA